MPTKMMGGKKWRERSGAEMSQAMELQMGCREAHKQFL